MLGFSLIFFVTLAFCASGSDPCFCPDYQNGISEDTFAEVRSLARKVGMYLKQHEGQECSEASLRALEKNAKNGRRNLYRAIIELRYQHYNIVHHVRAKKFQLIPGVWPLDVTSYEAKLWELLHNERMMRKTTIDLMMELSDMGYMPNSGTIEALKMLKRFMGSTLSDEQTSAFERRRALWQIIMAEQKCCKKYYYANYPQMRNLVITEEDMCYMTKCWRFYQRFLQSDIMQKQEDLKKFLKEHQEGVTINTINSVFPSKEQEAVDGWDKVCNLLRYGYARHIRYYEGRIFWSEDMLALPMGTQDVVEDVCAIVYRATEFSERLTQEALLFSLYQRGHFDIKWQDLEPIMDALVVMGRIHDCPPVLDYSCENLKYIWECEVQNVSLSAQLSLQMSSRVRVLKHLAETGVLTKIQHKQNVNIVSFLREDVVIEAEEECLPSPAKKLCVSEEKEFPGLSQEKALEMSLAVAQLRFSATKGDAMASFELPETLMNAPTTDGVLEGDAAHLRRDNVLAELTKIGSFVTARHLLSKFYEEDAKEEYVLEDVLHLIYLGHNIQYKESSYRVLSEDFAIPLKEGDARDVFAHFLRGRDFTDLPVTEQTYRLYEQGYRAIHLSTVALYTSALCRATKMDIVKLGSNARMPRLVLLKDRILQEGRIHKKGAYVDLQPVESSCRRDLDVIRKSLCLYVQGREILNRDANDARFHLRHSEALLAHLQRNFGKPCSIKSLYTYFTPSKASVLRDLYRSAAVLRTKGKYNIEYNPAGPTLTLHPGRYVSSPRCFRRAYWEMLCDPKGSPPMIDAFWALSNDGLNPEWSEFVDINELHKLCFYPVDPYGNQGFFIKQKVWAVILEEHVVHDTSYYERHERVRATITKNNLYALGRCWRLYSMLCVPAEGVKV